MVLRSKLLTKLIPLRIMLLEFTFVGTFLWHIRALTSENSRLVKLGEITEPSQKLPSIAVKLPVAAATLHGMKPAPVVLTLRVRRAIASKLQWVSYVLG